ncbi:MAG TPA: twin-arginine translocase TatA/TatE family subunit [Candidatus Azoamicus sp. MARI]
MGFSGISPMSLLLIFLIIILLFGTKKLRNIGEDLGHAFKSFRKGIQQIDEQKENIDDKKEEK